MTGDKRGIIQIRFAASGIIIMIIAIILTLIRITIIEIIAKKKKKSNGNNDLAKFLPFLFTWRSLA